MSRRPEASAATAKPEFGVRMRTRLPDALDTRLVFRIYGWTAIVTGIVVSEWPNIGAFDLADALQPAARLPFGIYVVPRLAGFAIVAGGITALAMAVIEDPADRRRCLLRFGLAHLIFGWPFFAVTHAILGSIFPSLLSWAPGIVGVLLTYLALTASSLQLRIFPRPVLVAGSARHAGVLVERGRCGDDPLRAQYEEQIRRAAQQEERARLARDLHDAVKQQLFVVQTAAATAEKRLGADADGARAALRDVRTASREALGEMQAMIDNLQAAPLENAGLVESLRTQCEALGFRTGAGVRLEVGELPASDALGPGAQQTLFRFAQEALANVGRHARARNVVVGLGLEKDVFSLTVQDDGVGFDATKWGSGMGRHNMISRATELRGTCMIQSEPGQGTTVRCVVPIPRRTPARYLRRAALSAAVVAAMLPVLLSGTLDHYDLVRAVALAVAAAAGVSALRYLGAAHRLHGRSTA